MWRRNGGREEREKMGKRKGGGKKEGWRRLRRPTNVEGLVKERVNNVPLLEMFRRGEKRKERQEVERKVEGMEATLFKKSTKMEIADEGDRREMERYCKRDKGEI